MMEDGAPYYMYWITTKSTTKAFVVLFVMIYNETHPLVSFCLDLV